MLLPLEDLGGFVVVAEVIGGDRAEPLDAVWRDLGVRRQRLEVRLQQLGKDVSTVHIHGTLPGEMVESDVIELHASRLDTQVIGEKALETDGHVAESDRPMSIVKQCFGD